MLDFLTHLEQERGLTRNTREAYRVDLLQFGAFLARRGSRACSSPSSCSRGSRDQSQGPPRSRRTAKNTCGS